MKIHPILITIFVAIFSCYAYAEAEVQQINTVDYSIIRSAGAVCGSGLAVDAKGQVDSNISRLFGGISATGNTRLDLGQVKKLLEQFSENQSKEAVYKTYVACVLQTITAIVGISKQTKALPVIDNLIIPDPLVTIQDGQKFAMTIGESRAIGRDSLVLTINKIVKQRGNYPSHVYYSYSDADNGRNINNKFIYQANLLKFSQDCSVTPYKIDTTEGKEKVSFLTKCKSTY